MHAQIATLSSLRQDILTGAPFERPHVPIGKPRRAKCRMAGCRSQTTASASPWTCRSHPATSTRPGPLRRSRDGPVDTRRALGDGDGVASDPPRFACWVAGEQLSPVHFSHASDLARWITCSEALSAHFPIVVVRPTFQRLFGIERAPMPSPAENPKHARTASSLEAKRAGVSAHRCDRSCDSRLARSVQTEFEMFYMFWF